MNIGVSWCFSCLACCWARCCRGLRRGFDRLVGKPERPRFRGTERYGNWTRIARSLRPDAGEFDYPTPLLNLGYYMVAELRGSEDFWLSGDFRQPRLDGRVR